MNKSNVNYIINENKYNQFNENRFTKCVQFWQYFHAVAKSTASRGKLNILKANTSTPLNRAFFVRNVRTSKENALGVILSMVERNRQPLAVGYVPLVVVFHPVTFYRPTVESLAVDPENKLKDTAAMIYLFAGISRQTYDRTCLTALRIEADSQEQARAQLARDFVLIPTGQINPIHTQAATKARLHQSINHQVQGANHA